MANQPISADAPLAAGSIATGDLLPVVDISEPLAADKNKNVSFSTLTTYFNTNLSFASTGHNHDADYISIVTTPTTGNFPQLTAGGELVNSIYDETSFATAGHNHDADYISIVATPTTGNFPQLTAGGELVNSAYDETSFDAAGTASSAVSTHESTYDHTKIYDWKAGTETGFHSMGIDDNIASGGPKLVVGADITLTLGDALGVNDLLVKASDGDNIFTVSSYGRVDATNQGTGSPSFGFRDWSTGTQLNTGISGEETTFTIVCNNAQRMTIHGDLGYTTFWQGEFRLPEKAAHNATATASNGLIWVKNDIPNALMFTNDAGTDMNLVYPAWSRIQSTPTTLSGYGISDTQANFNTALSDGSFAFAGGAFHDGFSDYVANEHIDWTNATQNLVTTGVVSGGGFEAAGAGTVGIYRDFSNVILSLSGGLSATAGANIQLYGPSYTGKLGYMEFRNDSTITAQYSPLISTWDFQANAITTTGTLSSGNATFPEIMLTNPFGEILKDDNTGAINIAAGTAVTSGANILLHGSAYTVPASSYDMTFRTATTNRLKWDHSELAWDFSAQNVYGMAALGINVTGTLSAALHVEEGNIFINKLGTSPTGSQQFVFYATQDSVSPWHAGLTYDYTNKALTLWGGGASIDFDDSAQVFNINDVEAMRLQSTGELAINAISDGVNYNGSDPQLRVFQDDSRITAVFHRVTADSSPPNVRLLKSRGTIAAPTYILAGDQIGNLNWAGFYTNTAGITAAASIRVVAETDFSTTDQPGDTYMRFSVSSGGTGDVERMRLTSAGNLGIGMSPTYALDISHAVGQYSPAIRVQNTTTVDSWGRIDVLDDAGNIGMLYQINNTLTLRCDSASSNVTLDAQNANLFLINHIEKARVHSNGFFGIGTQSPSVELHVKDPSSSVEFRLEASGAASNMARIMLLEGGDTAYSTSYELYKQSGNVYYLNRDTGAHWFYIAGNEILHVATTGVTIKPSGTISADFSSSGLSLFGTTSNNGLTQISNNTTYYNEIYSNLSDSANYGWIFARQGTAVLKYTESNILEIAETSSTPGATAGWGKMWVKNATPAELWFKDDSSSNIQISMKEGTWTPTIQDASLSDAESQTYTIQSGKYWVIGNLCFIWVDVQINSLGTLTGTQTAYLANLPFTASSGYGDYTISFCLGSSLATTVGANPSGRIIGATTRASLDMWDSAVGTTAMTINELSAGGRLIGNGWYRIQ